MYSSSTVKVEQGSTHSVEDDPTDKEHGGKVKDHGTESPNSDTQMNTTTTTLQSSKKNLPFKGKILVVTALQQQHVGLARRLE